MKRPSAGEASVQSVWRRFGEHTAGSPLARAAQSGRPPIRLAPVDEIVAAPELEQMAELVLSRATFDTVRGGERGAFDRMTFRQRLMVYAMDLDLTTELLGQQMFAPIVVGPVANQRVFHPEGELETVRGAGLNQTTTVVSSRSSYPINEIAAVATAPLWYQVYGDDDAAIVRADVAGAEGAGCGALCITVGVSADSSPTTTDWDRVARLRDAATVPTMLKGVMSAASAEHAVRLGFDALVVSNHGHAGPLPLQVLPSVVAAVGDGVPVLVDGGFVRGSDILKGLALGAAAVMLARPVMWGLSAYGASGVDAALYLLINELARNMAASGRPTIAQIDSSLVRWDSR